VIQVVRCHAFSPVIGGVQPAPRRGLRLTAHSKAHKRRLRFAVVSLAFNVALGWALARRDDASPRTEELAGGALSVSRVAATADLPQDPALEGSEPRWMTDEEIANARQDFGDLLAEFRQAMSPAEIEDLELRMMTVDVLDVWGVEEQFGSALSGREFHEVLRIRRGDSSTFENLFVMELLEARGPTPIQGGTPMGIEV
jgi:hypothetical protein